MSETHDSCLSRRWLRSRRCADVAAHRGVSRAQYTSNAVRVTTTVRRSAPRELLGHLPHATRGPPDWWCRVAHPFAGNLLGRRNPCHTPFFRFGPHEMPPKVPTLADLERAVEASNRRSVRVAAVRHLPTFHGADVFTNDQRPGDLFRLVACTSNNSEPTLHLTH